MLVDTVDNAAALFNEWSPRFTASLISEDSPEQARLFNMVDAPFVSNGYTRWVDGTYTFNRPRAGSVEQGVRMPLRRRRCSAGRLGLHRTVTAPIGWILSCTADLSAVVPAIAADI